jgi:hypothetical protein
VATLGTPQGGGQLALLPLADLPTRAALDTGHYLGAAHRGVVYRDEFGILVVAPPTSRRLPADRWLELVRWCLYGERNGGSRQWARARRWIRATFPAVTTVVSYSDPAVGHTGALYRACNWLWAPTWHRLRPPPTGNGNWGLGQSGVKDRWVFPLLPDPARLALLELADAGLVRRYPWASYVEPRFKRGIPVPGTGGADYGRWVSHGPQTEEAR